MELKEEWNKALKEQNMDFFRFSIADKRGWRGEPYFGVQLSSLNRDAFQDFLDDLATSEEASLEDKYQYLMMSKSPKLEVESKSTRESQESIYRVQQAVKEEISSEQQSIEEELDHFLSNLSDWQDELQTYWQRRLWQSFGTFPTTHLYLMEMETILKDIKSMVQRGSFPPCYREMRKLLENLSWAVFDDLLFINADYYRYFNGEPEPEQVVRPFFNANQEWYDWNQGVESKDFKKERNNLRDRILEQCQKSRLRYHEKYDVSKPEITELLKKEIGYPLYITLSGVELDDKEEVEDFARPYEAEDLKPLVKLNLEGILKELKQGNALGKLDQEFVSDTADHLLESEEQYIVPPFPSNKRVIKYLDKLWARELDNELYSFYSEYSFFIHSYRTSWQLFPYSSVLEFKIFESEIRDFRKTVTDLVEIYLENCY
ncbi:MAG: hypothetical protein ABEJ72_06990 [Candidatus Aenigmatarchaeota archaeon]